MRARRTLAIVALFAGAALAGCSTDKPEASTDEPLSTRILHTEAVTVDSGPWRLEVKYVDSNGDPDAAEDGDLLVLLGDVPNIVKGECVRSDLDLDQCYRASFEAAVDAAESRGDLPAPLGCTQVKGPIHSKNGLIPVNMRCKVGWTDEAPREYPSAPVAEPLQFDSNGTVWLRVAEAGRDVSCTLLRLPMTQECVAATPEQVALIYPRVTDVVGYEQSEGGGWTSGKYLVLRVRGEQS